MDTDTATLLAPAAPPRASATPAGGSTRRSSARQGEYLSFRVGAEEYALDILNVQEIRSYEQPTRLAGAGACIKGVVNLRGVIVPVVDLRVALGVEAPRFDAFTVVVVLNVLRRVIGVVVDSVSDVVALSAEQIREAPEFHGALDASFIVGLAALEHAATGHERHERLLIVADIEQLLSTPQMGLADGLSAAALQ